MKKISEIKVERSLAIFNVAIVFNLKLSGYRSDKSLGNHGE